jgi:hypothetical protein
MSEDAALRPSSYVPPAASGPAEEPMPKPQPNGCQLGMAHWQPGARFWPWRSKLPSLRGGPVARGQAASRQPQAPAVPASSRVQVPGALPRSLSALERTISTAVHEASSRRAFYVPRPCCLSEAPRRRPPEPQFGRRGPLPSGGARGHPRAHRHARKKARRVCRRLEVLCRNLYEEQHAAHAGYCYGRGSPAATVDHRGFSAGGPVPVESSGTFVDAVRAERVLRVLGVLRAARPTAPSRRRKSAGSTPTTARRTTPGVLSGYSRGYSRGYSWGYSEGTPGGTPGVLRGYCQGHFRGAPGYSRGAASHADRRHARTQP